MVENNLVVEPWPKALDKLKPKLNGYRGNQWTVYIGATQDPDRRFEEHKAKGGYSRLVVVYEAFNPRVAREVEQELIDYAHRCGFRSQPDNIAAGGENIEDGSGRWFIYFALR